MKPNHRPICYWLALLCLSFIALPKASAGPATLRTRRIVVTEGSAPAAIADRAQLYAKDVAGTSKMFVMDSAGNEVDLTTGGGGGGTPGGSDSQIQYNNGGSFGGDSALAWDDGLNAKRLTAGNVTVSTNLTLPAVGASKRLATDASGNVVASTDYGYVWIDAGSCLIPAASGATPTTYQGSGADATADVLQFADGATTYAETKLSLPEWDGTASKAKFFWLTSAASGDVKWGIEAGSLGDNESASATIYGTAATVTDGSNGAGDDNISGATGSLTVAGSPAEEDLLYVRLSRVGGDVADTLEATANLKGVLIQYRKRATHSAW